MAKTSDSNALTQFAWGLAALEERMEGPEAVSAAVALTEALGRTTDASAATALASALTLVAERLGPAESAVAATALVESLSKINFTLNQGMGSTIDPAPLTQALTAVLSGCDPAERSRRTAAVVAAAGAGPGWSLAALSLSAPAAEPLACRLSTEELANLLKQPTCLAASRRVVLDYLEYRYHRAFRDQWEFVEYARLSLTELDLTSAPKRPKR
jgi:hypothetical protein